MRKSKKLLSLLVTVIMLFSSVTAAFAIESSYTVKADERIVVTVTDCNAVFVKFVPEKTATYEFRSDCKDEKDPYAKVYDESEFVIAAATTATSLMNSLLKPLLLRAKPTILK
ncbi:MAG: hypothetical protein IKB94_03815 [Clostridia bacterium]|nr:hypothetical protein [Clostridia bacterium]